MGGGAKAGMRRGGRNGGRGGSSRRGGSNHAAETGMDMGGGGSGRRACVGLCYLRKLQGKDPLPERKPKSPVSVSATSRNLRNLELDVDRQVWKMGCSVPDITRP